MGGVSMNFRFPEMGIPFYDPHRGSGADIHYAVEDNFLVVKHGGEIPHILIPEHLTMVEGSNYPFPVPCAGEGCQYCRDYEEYRKEVDRELYLAKNDKAVSEFELRSLAMDFHANEPVSKRQDYRQVLIFNLKTMRWEFIRMSEMIWARFLTALYGVTDAIPPAFRMEETVTVRVQYGTGFKPTVKQDVRFTVIQHDGVQDNLIGNLSYIAGKYLQKDLANVMAKFPKTI